MLTTSKFDGNYRINTDGYYFNSLNLKADTVIDNHFYTNINNVKYNDGFMFGLNSEENTFYEYQ